MGIVDSSASWVEDVGFSGGSAFVLCPSDVLVEELVVGCGLCPFVLAGLEALDGFEFQCAGNGNRWG